MRYLFLFLVLFGVASCSSVKPNFIDWANATLNDTPFGTWGVTTNHYNLKGDVKEAYSVEYFKRDSTYISSLLSLVKFNKDGKLISLRLGLFKKLADGETKFYYDKDGVLVKSFRQSPSRKFEPFFFYDKSGKLILQKSDDSKTKYFYDKRDNLIEIYHNNNVLPSTSYSYDKKSRVINKTNLNVDGSLRAITTYNYTLRGSNLIVNKTYTNKKDRNETRNYCFDKYGYNVIINDSTNNIINEIKRDSKGNVIVDIRSDKKRYYVIKYWDGTTSGYDPRLDLPKQ